MHHFKYVMPCIIGSAFCLKVWAQSEPRPDLLQNIIPPSPNAAALARFGEIPVGLYNGIPDISVPVHDLSAGKIRLPVSLSYHAGGIRVEETASAVGLGWSLNAGGAIVRQTRGLPDESTFGYLNTNQQVRRYMNNQMTTSEQEQFFEAVAKGHCDTEPDLYFYNIGGLSGKFYLDSTGKAVSIPRNALRFEMLGSGWEMTDNAGIRYVFQESETTTSWKSTGQLAALPPAGENYLAITAWYVSRVYIPGTAYELKFEYEPYTNQFFTLAPQTYYIKDSYAGDCQAIPPSGLGELIQNNIQCRRLIRIAAPHETITFHYSNLLRLDLETDKALEKISVRNRSGQLVKDLILQHSGLASQAPGLQPGHTMYNNRLMLLSAQITHGNGLNGGRYRFTYHAGQLPGRLSCNQDMWGYFNGANNDSKLVPTTTLQTSNGTTLTYTLANRLVVPDYAKFGTLQKMEYPTGGAALFEFEGNQVSSYVNKKTSPDQGYVSVGTKINGLGTLFESEEFTIQDINPGDLNPYVSCQLTVSNGGCGGGLANLSCPMFSLVGVDNPYHAAINASSSIELLPGKYKILLDMSGVETTDPVFASTYAELYFPLVPQPSIYSTFQLKAGGLRVKSVTHVNQNNAFLHAKYYSYQLPGTLESSGTIGRLPEYLSTTEFLKNNITSWGATYWYNCRYITLSSSTNYPLSNTKGGVAGYSYVKVSDDSRDARGYTEHYFTSHQSHPDQLYDGFPFAPATDNDWQRGLPLKEVVWAANGKKADGSSAFRKLSTREISYTRQFEKTYAALKTGQRFFNQTITDPYAGNTYWLECKPYDLATGIFVPAEERTITYGFNGDSSVQVTTQTYHPANFQITQKKTRNALNQEIVFQQKFPPDFPSNPALRLLAADNRITEPVEEVVMNTATSREISKTQTEYTILSGTQGTYSDISKMHQSAGSNLMQEVLHVQLRDQNRNILQALGKDGVMTAYIYGYQHTLPVAKITGVTYAAASALINVSAIQSLDGASLRTALAPLLQMPNAFATLYTYAPGLGVTSETSANGRLSMYEYDALGRLLHIRDQDNNILKKFCYNYAGDLENCN